MFVQYYSSNMYIYYYVLVVVVVVLVRSTNASVTSLPSAHHRARTHNKSPLTREGQARQPVAAAVVCNLRQFPRETHTHTHHRGRTSACNATKSNQGGNSVQALCLLSLSLYLARGLWRETRDPQTSGQIANPFSIPSSCFWRLGLQ